MAHVVADTFLCTREATIKKLYVEDFECSDTSKKHPEKRYLSTDADNDSYSLLAEAGSLGFKTAVIKGVRSGAGIKINSYNRHMQINSNLRSKKVQNVMSDAVLLDEALQEVKVLKAGRNVSIVADEHSVMIHADPIIKSVNDTGMSIVDDGLLKKIVYPFATESSTKIVFGVPPIVSGTHPTNVTYDENRKRYVVNFPVLRNSQCPRGLKLKNNDLLRSLIFNENFVVEENSDNAIISLSNNVITNAHTNKQNTVRLLGDGRKIKHIESGKGVLLKEDDNIISIHAYFDGEQLFDSLKSNTLELTKVGPRTHIELKNSLKCKAEKGTHALLNENTISALRAGNNINILQSDNVITIHNNYTPTSVKDVNGSALINKFNLFKKISASGLIQLKDDGREIALSVDIPKSFGEGENIHCGGLNFKSIIGGGKTKVSSTDKMIAIEGIEVKNARTAEGFELLQENYTIKKLTCTHGLKFSGRKDVLCLNVDVPNIVKSKETGGEKLCSDGQLKTLMCTGKIKCVSNKDSLLLDVPDDKVVSAGGDGRSMINNKNEVKRIIVSPGLDIISTDTCIRIDSSRLDQKVADMEKELSDIKKDMLFLRFMIEKKQNSDPD